MLREHHHDLMSCHVMTSSLTTAPSKSEWYNPHGKCLSRFIFKMSFEVDAVITSLMQILWQGKSALFKVMLLFKVCTRKKQSLTSMPVIRSRTYAQLFCRWRDRKCGRQPQINMTHSTFRKGEDLGELRTKLRGWCF